MKQALQLKLGQSLSMTPQMQQAIRMLQLGTLELRAEVMQALETNPFLELEEAPSTSEAPVTEDLDVHHAEYEQRMFEAAQWQVSASSNKSYDNSDPLHRPQRGCRQLAGAE